MSHDTDELVRALRLLETASPHDRHRAARAAASPDEHGPLVDAVRLVMTAFAAPSQPVSTLRPLDVLVVDDDVPLRETTAEVLRTAGWSARTADDGRQALDLLGDRMPDLILLDLMMPVMSGWQLLEELARRPRRPPVLIISSAEPGAVAPPVLRKPFRPDELLSAVRTLTATA